MKLTTCVRVFVNYVYFSKTSPTASASPMRRFLNFILLLSCVILFQSFRKVLILEPHIILDFQNTFEVFLYLFDLPCIFAASVPHLNRIKAWFQVDKHTQNFVLMSELIPNEC
jgi:hypothetical protein